MHKPARRKMPAARPIEKKTGPAEDVSGPFLISTPEKSLFPGETSDFPLFKSLIL